MLNIYQISNNQSKMMKEQSKSIWGGSPLYTNMNSMALGVYSNCVLRYFFFKREETSSVGGVSTIKKGRPGVRGGIGNFCCYLYMYVYD